MLNAIPRKLIIVGNEDTDVYCEYLSMLVSTIGNVRDEHGEDDGVSERPFIDTAIWTEKIYRDNRAHTSSRQKMLFVGNEGCARNVIKNIQMNAEDTEYGIYFGWLGNKAAIHVDDSILGKRNDLYESFLNKSKELSERYNHCVEQAMAKRTAMQKGLIAGINAVMPGLGLLAIPIAKKIDEKKGRCDQAYRYAVLKFFLDHIEDFMR
jgi:hypothetical protein